MKYGVPFLFLTPEYVGEVSALSFLIVGFSFGGFIMAFNISSYIVNGHRFPFIATLSRPFFKYYLNNGPWGIILILTYLFFSTKQLLSDGLSWSEILIYEGSFIMGFILITSLSLGYFINTNKDFIKLFGPEPRQKKTADGTPIHAVLHKKVKASRFFNRDREWNVETYLISPFKINLARSIEHYDNEMLEKVFKQNHFNAAKFEIAAIISVILLSFGSTISYFNIPAGASVTLLLTILIMFTSAIHSWFRGWASAVLIVLFLLLNHLSQYSWFSPVNKAYGLDYNTEQASYNDEHLGTLVSEENYRSDYYRTLRILENWKKKAFVSKQGNKPKMIFINTTGGGMRSSLWTFYCMQHIDELSGGHLLNNTQLLTGSSGGMIGISYLRELYLQQKNGTLENFHDVKHAENLSKDILNSIGFTMTVNDFLFKIKSFESNGTKHKIDRGYAFEDQLNANTNAVLNKTLADYREDEFGAKIPMAIISPTIVNDGRRLIISSQPASYFSYTQPEKNIHNDALIESVEFSRFFKNQQADSLKFTTALRMSSTFPYIMPIVHLPSQPTMEVMDAGLRDNFGIKTSLKFLYTFRNWIEANTSGVIFIQIRDAEKQSIELVEEHPTFIKSIASPVGNIYKNLFITQDYEHDQLIQYTSEWFDGTVNVINFAIADNEQDQLSLSWHLTEKEKKQVYESISSVKNQQSIKRFLSLLKDDSE